MSLGLLLPLTNQEYNLTIYTLKYFSMTSSMQNPLFETIDTPLTSNNERMLTHTYAASVSRKLYAIKIELNVANPEWADLRMSNEP